MLKTGKIYTTCFKKFKCPTSNDPFVSLTQYSQSSPSHFLPAYSSVICSRYTSLLSVGPP